MKLDAKRLDELARRARGELSLFRFSTARDSVEELALDELLRLARLGLWAEEKGVPTLQSVQFCGIICDPCGERVDSALATLPKEGVRPDGKADNRN